ncbi:MAG: hypothetical protein KDD44_00495 [Bdellovibrionales bacterium]|nr:hypothetical protein [Bdellovibrionales bacterium]
MLISAFGYLLLLTACSAKLGRVRGFIIVSPLPIIVFLLPLLEWFAFAMSAVALPCGLWVLQAQGTDRASRRRILAAIVLSELPLLILGVVLTLST